jgi:hypothetical protein
MGERASRRSHSLDASDAACDEHDWQAFQRKQMVAPGSIEDKRASLGQPFSPL